MTVYEPGQDCETFKDEEGRDFVITNDGKKRRLGLVPDTRPVVATSLTDVMNIPDANELKKRAKSGRFDFGRQHYDSTWTKDQNGWGKCASSAAVYAVEKARHIHGQPRIELSDDYLYSLVNDGRDRGSTLGENMRAIMARGIATRKTVAEGQIYRSRMRNRAAADREALRFRAHECYLTPGEREVAAALLAGHIVVIAIHVGRNWQRFDSRGVLIGDRGPGNHCEHLDDIRVAPDGEFEFRKHSSHGVRYGDGGFCWIRYKHLAWVHSSHAKYSVPAAIQDPQTDPFADHGDDETEPEPIDAPKLIVQSGEFCGWCKKWNDNDRPVLLDQGYDIRAGSVPSGRSGIPQFKLEVGGKSKIHVSYWSANSILREAANMKTAAAFQPA